MRQVETEFEGRLRIFLCVLAFFFLAIILRLFWVQIIGHEYWNKKSLNQRTRIIPLNQMRGEILDRNGNVLAASIDTWSVFTQKDGFAWVARRLPRGEAEKIISTNPQELIIQKEKKRIYPKGELAAQLIGFAGGENQGLAGVEMALDKYLKGKEGKVITEGDPEGRELYGALREIEPGESGMNVTLTIDENIQYIAEREIAAQIKKSNAKSGMLLVMNAKTGEILALASKPDFNPNEYGKYDRKLWHPVFLDPYEPGSTFKLITAASGLDEGVIDMDSKLKALNKLEIGGKVIENSHQIHWKGPEMTISFMLEQSANTGAAQIGIKLGPEKFYNHLKKFGFGEEIGIGLWGESAGILRRWQNWYKPDVAMITFGQSIAVTPMQLMAAVSAFANDGIMVHPYVIKKVESTDGKFVRTFAGWQDKRAVSRKTAEEMKTLMRNVVLFGSGKRAKMEYFTVGGKTGTAQKAMVGGRGYMKGHYIASFIGLAPVTNPQLIALVIIDDPKGSIWGESVAGPVFKDVVEYSLRYLNTRPDMI